MTKPIVRQRLGKQVSKKRTITACLFSTAAVVSAMACGSASDSSFATGSDGGSGSDDDGSGIGSGDGGGGFGKGDAGDSGKGNADSGLNACAADTQQAKLAPLDIVLMQDVSGSMWEDIGTTGTSATTSKYTAVKAALNTFTADPTSAGISIGLQYFPLFFNNIPNSCTVKSDCGASGGSCIEGACTKGSVTYCVNSGECNGGGTCTPVLRCAGDPEILCITAGDCTSNGVSGPCNQPLMRGECQGDYFAGSDPISCTPTDYAVLPVPIAMLPGAGTAIGNSLSAHIPNGLTPTYSALQGAYAAARLYSASHAGDEVAVVLSTDGIPNSGGGTGCDDVTADIEALASSALTGTPSIKTFVIGVLSPVDNTVTATNLLNGIASSGGTTAASIIGTSSTTESDFVAALQKIRGQSLPCQFALPVPDAGTPDYSKVNVVYTDSKTSTADIVPYVGALADCAADGGANGGWYYDVDPFTDSGTPSKVLLCPATCGVVQADPTGKVDVVQGCKTTTTGGGPPR
ncbi:MAG: hypothetical protein ABI183_20150 [Polyangiaceae bacterium]